MKALHVAIYMLLGTALFVSLGILMYAYADFVKRETVHAVAEALSARALAVRNGEESLQTEILSAFQSEEFQCAVADYGGDFVTVSCKKVIATTATLYPLMTKDVQGLQGLEKIKGLQLICNFSYRRERKQFEMNSCKVHKGISV